MQGDIKTCSFIHDRNRKILSEAAEIRKAQRIAFIYTYGIISVGIGDGSATTTAKDGYGFEWFGSIHIKDGTMNGNILREALQTEQEKQPW